MMDAESWAIHPDAKYRVMHLSNIATSRNIGEIHLSPAANQPSQVLTPIHFAIARQCYDTHARWVSLVAPSLSGEMLGEKRDFWPSADRDRGTWDVVADMRKLGIRVRAPPRTRPNGYTWKHLLT